MIKYKSLQQTRSMCPSLRGSSVGAQHRRLKIKKESPIKENNHQFVTSRNFEFELILDTWTWHFTLDTWHL